MDAASPRASAAVPSTRNQPRNSDQILRRNVFCSACGNVLDPGPTATVEESESESEEPVDPNQPLGPCDGNLRLVGSLVNTRNPERSTAAVAGGTGDAEIYRVGMDVEGRAIRAVHTSSLVLQPASGGPCRLAMFVPQPTTPPPARPTPAVRAQRANASGPDDAALDEGINKVSDTQYNVQRSLLDSLLEDQAALMKLARVIPHQENGRTVGVKLYGIRRNSVLGRLGIQNGDMLRTINGFDMSDATGALEAFAKLRGADSLSVSLVRRGNPQTYEYTVQ